MLCRSGKALYVGLSNYDGKTLSEAAAILKDLHCPFVINQNRYSIFDRTVEKNGLKKTTGILKKGSDYIQSSCTGTVDGSLSEWYSKRQSYQDRRKISERKHSR